MANLTGMHKQTKISVPGNQMFITFGSNSATFVNKGFKAYIYEIGIIDHKIFLKLQLIQIFLKLISIYF